MHGLEKLRHMNDQAAARSLCEHLEPPLLDAVVRKNWVKAKRLGREIAGLRRFVRGESSVFPKLGTL